MRLKKRFKSCLWSKTNIWGTLLAKENTFLKPKWDNMISILRSQRRRHRPLANINRYRYPIWSNQKLLQPRSKPNQVFKYNRLNYKNTLIILLCLRRFYGDLNYQDLKNICLIASKSKNSVEHLLRSLEGRLDVCLYRLGFFHSIYYSRQAILHNGVLVNGKKVNNSGFVLQKGDYVEFCSEQREAIKTRLLARYKHYRHAQVRLERWRLSHKYKLELHLEPTPSWIQTDYSNLSFMFSADVSSPVFYPFKANLDEAIWASKYGYR